jgi:iron complex outermembrane receptor protein
MTIKHIIMALLCLWSTTLLGQTITGTIKSNSGDPISYATISILNTSKATAADQEGKFALPLPIGKYKIQFTAVGFASKLQEIEVAEENSPLEILLIESTDVLGEVVVTANKREEDLMRVGSSISSLSDKKIEDTRTWGLGGLTALIPNYTYQELGVPFQQVQSIRGIQVFSENPAVSTYVDDVNSMDILANGFAFTDIERIEVLRGPQGTLFGRNAMGGVINVYTKKPTNKTSGFSEVSLGNLGLQRYSAGFKTPIVSDKLFFGLNALYQSQDGYWKNDTTGTVATDGKANGKLVGGETNVYANLFLKWLPSDRLELVLNLKGQRDWSTNTGFFVSQADRDLALANPDKIQLARIGEHERNIMNNSLVAKYYGSNLTLTSISAYQTIDLSFKDIDFPGFYHSFYQNEIGEKLPPQKVFSQEIRINSNTEGKLSYTAGLYGFSQVGFEPSTNLAFESPLFPNTYFIFRNKSTNYGIAGFGEVTYQVAPKLKWTAGLRYDFEEREATFNGFGDAVFSNGKLVQTVSDTTLGGTYSALSPKMGLNYTASSGALYYATFTRGFRAGGVNAQKVPENVSQTFDPEFSNNYEIGYKTFTSSKKTSLTASAFLIQWKDLQFFNLVAPFTYARENVGDAQSLGLELELTTIPVKGLQLDGSLGINQTEYKSFNLTRVSFTTGEEKTTSIGGNSLSNAPSHTAFLGTQYTLPMQNEWALVIRGEIRSIGEYYTDIQNQILQPNYTLVNSRISVNHQNYSLALWGQNLTNERYLAFGNPDSSFGKNVRTSAPATFGITLSAKF